MRESKSRWWTVMVAGPGTGVLLGAIDSVVNHVPKMAGEVGTARAERGGWLQVGEFMSLLLDAGWAWAATAVLAGWLAGQDTRPWPGILRGSVAGCLALVFATSTYYAVDILFDGGGWWNWTTQYWLIRSAALGPALGLVGALIRRDGPIGALAALVVPAGASAQMVMLPPAAESLMAEPVRWSVWITSAAATVLIVSASRPASSTAASRRPRSPRQW